MSLGYKLLIQLFCPTDFDQIGIFFYSFNFKVILIFSKHLWRTFLYSLNHFFAHNSVFSSLSKYFDSARSHFLIFFQTFQIFEVEHFISKLLHLFLTVPGGIEIAYQWSVVRGCTFLSWVTCQKIIFINFYGFQKQQHLLAHNDNFFCTIYCDSFHKNH